jgi:hypothetical protein
MFAYSGQGRGAVTEAFVDKIFEIKNRREGGNFQDLL